MRSRNCTCLAIMNDPARHFKECPERRELLTGATKINDSFRESVAKTMARAALRDLAKRDLIYEHHGVMHARGDETYAALAKYFEAFAAGRDVL